jgi:hypothetical protein
MEMRPVLRFLPFAMAAILLAGSAIACVEGDLRGEMVTAERLTGALPAGENTTFHLLGAGWFRAFEVVKHGGVSDNTTVTLELDGVEMITASFADLKKPWRQLSTAYLIANVRTEGDDSIMTIWYMPELKFRAMVALHVQVAEDGVDGVKMRTVMNKPAPHEHIPGQNPTTAALPAFR